MKFVSESNLYKLIFQSKKKEAEAFTDWVTSDVLPAIRKHGLYAIDDLLENPDMAIAALQKLKEERQLRLKAQEEVAQKNQIIQELQPKATYYDLVLQNKSLVAISVIAKDYGMSAKKMNKILHELKFNSNKGILGSCIKNTQVKVILNQKLIQSMQIIARCILTGLKKDACSFTIY